MCNLNYVHVGKFTRAVNSLPVICGCYPRRINSTIGKIFESWKVVRNEMQEKLEWDVGLLPDDHDSWIREIV